MGCLDLRRHLGQAERHRLMLGDRLAKGGALLRISDGELKSALRHAARARRYVHPADLDTIHHVGEAEAGSAAEDVVGLRPIAVEDELGGVDALVAHLVDLSGDA